MSKLWGMWRRCEKNIWHTTFNREAEKVLCDEGAFMVCACPRGSARLASKLSFHHTPWAI